MAKSFAAEYGTFLGAGWLVTFFLLIYGMNSLNAEIELAGFILLLIQPLFAIYLAWRFKQHIATGHRATWGQATLFAAGMFGCACTLSSVVEYLFFRFIDKDRTVTTIVNMLKDPNIQMQAKAMGIRQDMETIMELYSAMTPLDITVMLMSESIFIALILMLPTVYMAQRTSTRRVTGRR